MGPGVRRSELLLLAGHECAASSVLQRVLSCAHWSLVPCRVRAHAAHGEGRARATRAVPYAAAGRSEGGLQGWQGTRQLLIHSNISLPAIAYPEEGRGLLFVLF